MSTRSLFRLGAIATLLTALGYFAGEAIYLFGSAQTLFFAWYFIIVSIFQIFAYIALYAAQAKRGDIILFIGFVVSILGLLYSFMDSDRRLALRAGLVTQELISKGADIGSLAFLQTAGNAFIILGWIVFGIGVIRSGFFPRWAGILMILAGVFMVIRDFFIFEYFFAIFSSAAYGWLGWSLWKKAKEFTP